MTERYDVTTPERVIPAFGTVTLTIRPESRETFLTALREVLPQARAEAACLYLHAGQSVADPNVFVLSEGWSDIAEYRDVVLRRPYFQKYLRISEATYAKDRAVVILTPVELFHDHQVRARRADG
jgi:quinol monooxygenase YgiN